MKTEHIYECQNDEILLKCLYVQREKYSLAKRGMQGKIIIVFISTILSVVSLIYNCNELVITTAVFAIWGLLIGKWLDMWINSKKAEAAEIQQYFDVSLYSNVCSLSSGRWGNILTDSQVVEYIKSVPSMNLDHLKNWYSDYSKNESFKEILKCQNVNVCWDSELRKNYIYIGYAVISLILLFSAFCNNNIFIIISLLIPALDYCISNIILLDHDIKRLRNIRQKIISFEEKYEYINKTKKISRLVEIQYMIKEHRANCVLIPDWFYKSKKEKQQKEADDASQYS